MSTSEKVTKFDNLVRSLNKIIFGGEDEDVTLDGVIKPTWSKWLKSKSLILDNKADKTYVDASLTAIAGGHKAYATLAGALANTNTLPQNSIVEITNDGANNGTYYWNGADLYKSDYDPLTQAKADATTKANAAEANANSYTDNVTEPKLLSGEHIYYLAKDNPTRLFTAIWQEYNKPVYHLGNGTFVDVTGVTVIPHVVIPELVFKVKLTTDNETFIFPTINTTALPINMQIDWGDGTTSSHSSYVVNHDYVGTTGDEFTVTVRGSAVPYFDFSSAGGGRNASKLMLHSIEKNTLPPRSMDRFSIQGCENIKYIGPSSFQSFNGTTLRLGLISYENITFHKDAFKGLQHITSIDNLFGGLNSTGKYTIPSGLFDYFISVTTAKAVFQKLDSNLPDNLLDKMGVLQVVADMFKEAKNVYVPQRIFKNQKILVDVSSCFRSSQLGLDSYQLYVDMNQGSPSAVGGVFFGANSMTNLANVPDTWKASS